MKKLLFNCSIAFVVLGFAGESFASVLYVDLNSVNPVAPYSSWGTASTNIQSAVDAAIDGDMVSVTNGYYFLSSEITVTNNITVQGINGPDVTLVDGGGSNRCFNLGSTDCLISGFTITNGYSSANGGGVSCDDTVPVVSNCVFIGNSAYGGGGMHFGTANNCEFIGNFSYGGGGMYNGVANSCLFSGNSVSNDARAVDTGSGGGMYFGTANDCEFRENSANTNVRGNSTIGKGGGMCNGMASHCIFNGNSADDGGGMYAFGYFTSMATNCIFIGNSAENLGGGVGGVYPQNMTLFNCVLNGNTAGGGGGIHSGMANNCTIVGNSASFGGGIMGDGFSVVNNCIVWGNTASVSNNLYSTESHRVIATHYTCSPDVGHGVDGNITNAPLLASTSHISTNSPCRGAGSATYTTGVDIDGETWLNPPSMGCDDVHDSVTGPLELSLSGPANISIGFEGKYAVSIQGAVTGNRLDFGDGTLITNALLATHAWVAPGSYNMVLTAFNDDYLGGVSITQNVQVVSAEATAVYVSEATGNDANDGFGWATAKKSIQSGVDVQIVYGGLVWVSNGTYAVTSEITVTSDIMIQSINGPEVTMVDGGGSNRCFNLGRNNCLISGFTITNGYSAANGGGVYCDHVVAVVSNCTISGNTSGWWGGGMREGTTSSCTISGNSAENGGGLAGVVANNCTISNNSASGSGGGMYGGTANNCMINDNSAEGNDGGGMCYSTANSCTIIENSASRDGGGMNYSRANSCTIIGNSAIRAGGGTAGGIANNCTITGNTAEGQGGGCFTSHPNPRDILNNCIVWGNSSTFRDSNDVYGFTVNYSCASDITPGENGSITNNPLFVDAANGDYHVQSNSPCINWGNNTYVSGSTDLDGNPRIIEDYVDMGCYEYQSLIGEADNDDDGMSDAWERQWFGINILSDGNADGDTSSNGDEYVSGTDPTNSASYFHVTTATAEVEGGARFIIEWTAVTGRVYNILWTPSLTQEFQPLEIGIQYPQNSYTDTVHSAESSGYYRVVVMRSDYDADGDGLPNDWEIQYAEAEAYADGDNDGFDNLAEFISGTDPTNEVSYFTAANSVAEVNGTNCFVVEWISIPDRLYSVQWSTNLTTGFQTLETSIEHPQNSYTDTLHNAESESFYKVDVRLK